MGIVLDTNVLVSAMLGPGRVPDLLVDLLLERRVPLLYDARIRAEYEDVVRRPKFKAIPSSRREAMLERLLSLGKPLEAVPVFEGTLSDPDDRIFVEVALAGRASALVTGNLKDYPVGLGFDVLPPATALAMLHDGALRFAPAP
ncbi:MAG: putative toxin-antitoxin system toxin component, PIN family [Polyangiaceae bacterium]